MTKTQTIRQKTESETKKGFTYLGFRFTPLKRFVGITESYNEVVRKVKVIGISRIKDDNPSFPFNVGGYSHEGFYAAANKAGCGEYDTYLMDGKITVIPGNFELFEYPD